MRPKFNLLCDAISLVCIPISGYLSRLSFLVVNSFNLQQYEDGNIKLLKALTEPFTKYIIKVGTLTLTKHQNYICSLLSLCCCLCVLWLVCERLSCIDHGTPSKLDTSIILQLHRHYNNHLQNYTQ